MDFPDFNEMCQKAFERGKDMGMLLAQGEVLKERTGVTAGQQIIIAHAIDELRKRERAEKSNPHAKGTKSPNN